MFKPVMSLIFPYLEFDGGSFFLVKGQLVINASVVFVNGSHVDIDSFCLFKQCNTILVYNTWD